MPKTRVEFFIEEDGTCPLLKWLDTLTRPAQAKCLARLSRLEELGHELRRPEADYLRDGIHELRTSHAGLNLRMLYFFSRHAAIVVSHGIVKQAAAVPGREIELAIRRKLKFGKDPKRHTRRTTEETDG